MTYLGTATDWTVRLWLLAALVAAPIVTDAQTVYRCVQKGKPTIFQNEPCPAATKTASAVHYVPNPNAPAYRPVITQPRRGQTSTAQVHQIPLPPNTSACEAARAHRDAVVGPNNQRGNVDVRRRLNDAVANACY